MSPLKVLGRGYAIVKNESGVISSVVRVEADEKLEIMVSDGVIRCRVDDKEERTWQ